MTMASSVLNLQLLKHHKIGISIYLHHQHFTKIVYDLKAKTFVRQGNE